MKLLASSFWLLLICSFWGLVHDSTSETTAAEEEPGLWSLQPVRSAAPPLVKDSEWLRSQIDPFILGKLEEKRLVPAARADKRTLIRRATFDLIGLPPTLIETDEFLSDESPDSYERVVDRLLASPRYGERWGRHWLDVVRYADARDLIQLPAESDFREAWRYRDWVVAAFNRDLPYDEFIRRQVAGDLMQPADSSQIDVEALVATGLLAIADFVPGDVDKQQMIADYVNDQIDVVGRAFLGLTLACARCHDHKFDPISTEDYYSLAGIFFSTRLVPGPIKGNTPLVRVPLLTRDEIAAREATLIHDKARLAELSHDIATFTDREYRAYLERQINENITSYLFAAWDFIQTASSERPSASQFAGSRGLQPEMFLRWIRYFEEPRPHPAFTSLRGVTNVNDGHEKIRELASKLEAMALRNRTETVDALNEIQPKNQAAAGPAAASDVQQSTARRESRPSKLAESELFRFRADDRRLALNEGKQVTSWPNRGRANANAIPVIDVAAPAFATVATNDHACGVLRFSGETLLQAAGNVPAVGSLFLVYRPDPTGGPGQRILGWEDSASGKHGIGLMSDGAGALHVIMRRDEANGDVVVPAVTAEVLARFQILCVTWGPSGVAVYRNEDAVGTNKAITSVSADPAITSLKIGGPGSGSAGRFRGDIAELRVYSVAIDEDDRTRLTQELSDRWRGGQEHPPKFDDVADLYEELTSSHSPFLPDEADRQGSSGVPHALQTKIQQRLALLREELETLKNKPAPPEIPQAVTVQDGGPPDTPHAGFQNAAIYLRGNHTKPGTIAPRGVPKAIVGPEPLSIKEGSGRRELARWLTDPANPLTARVMVNRIWQHHFGTGIVRTSANFGVMGDSPTHPELLDHLAMRFVASGWSTKTVHRMIMSSNTYQQSSGTDEAFEHANKPTSSVNDPENQFLGHANRRRLEVEAIRDSLLMLAGRLNDATGGPGFQDAANPRRSLYLMSVRTGAKTAEFGPLFDAPDCSGIVERRMESIVAPQALFLMNDALVTELAASLAERIAREVPVTDLQNRIRQLYEMTVGRLPIETEFKIGLQFLNDDPAETADSNAANTDRWRRYCQLILSTNEFIYID